MKHEYQTIKIWRETLKALRILAALREQTMVEVLQELVSKALQETGHNADDC